MWLYSLLSSHVVYRVYKWAVFFYRHIPFLLGRWSLNLCLHLPFVLYMWCLLTALPLSEVPLVHAGRHPDATDQQHHRTLFKHLNNSDSLTPSLTAGLFSPQISQILDTQGNGNALFKNRAVWCFHVKMDLGRRGLLACKWPLKLKQIRLGIFKI